MGRKLVVWGGLGIVAVLALLVGLNSLSKAPCLQLVGDLTCRVETDDKIVALTFDDGPTPRGVAAVLPILDRYDARATFFLIGEDLKRHPQAARQILAAGHELGNHTYSHQRNVGRSRAFYREELGKTRQLLRAVGSDSDLFRPPYGRKLVGLPLEVERAGLKTITWDVADRAEEFPEPADYARDIVERARPGSIILIHPMYRGNATAREALPMNLAQLRDRGYDIVTVSELLNHQSSASPQ
ncbi:polysaccharide deacetylase family protein [Citromicrobium bathyomarinum]|uniref:polysaccharide deacetylase family protein n=1 Tax=Citromicrobium bathyomarinum TaxID=72174 RepID=UPI001E623C05|nr:polysaccharide deacetylase family protein [Citromicrobium bathyomarinum]MCD1623644.1 polysaccharide deacetylase family protein [Citromicrobium bathyomarinum]